MYADYVKDPDDSEDEGPPEFDRDDLILAALPALLSSDTKETLKDNKIKDLELRTMQLDDELDMQKIRAKQEKDAIQLQLENLKTMYNELHAETVKLRAQVKKDDIITHS
jgi:hypothetical protein